MTRRGSKRTLARRALVLIAAAGCAHSAALPADHPADPRAPIGRLAPPSPTLAAGVVTYAEPPPATDKPVGDVLPPEPVHHHHH